MQSPQYHIIISPIWWPNEQINKVSIVNITTRTLQILHQWFCQPQPSIQRCNRHRTHMTMPKIATSFTFSQHITHDWIIRRLSDREDFGPTGHVLEVEGHVECFSEDVEVYVVEAEEVIHVEWACGRHDCGDGEAIFDRLNVMNKLSIWSCPEAMMIVIVI